jgi:hypothetical protein
MTDTHLDDLDINLEATLAVAFISAVCGMVIGALTASITIFWVV